MVQAEARESVCIYMYTEERKSGRLGNVEGQRMWQGRGEVKYVTEV